jgi:hypothetical protein
MNLCWLSYDLGVKGDYDGLYSWLDSHNAKECGDGLACFDYTIDGSFPTKLTKELKQAIDIGKRDRIYIIWRKQEGGVKGMFIFGTRKSAPWTGYAGGKCQSPEEEG